MRYLDKALAKCESEGRLMLDGFVYVLLFVLNPGHTWTEVKARKLGQSKPAYDSKFVESVADENLPLLLDEAKTILGAEESRRQTIDDKSKVLLTVGSLLLTANAVLLTRLGWNPISLMPAMFIFVSVFLVLVYFRVGSSGTVVLSSVDWAKSSFEVKRHLSRDIIFCANHLEPQNAFRVGVYRGALRSMIVGILILVPCFIWTQRQEALSDSRALQFLKEHKEIREALTGPPGPKGEPGPPGERGPVGPPGSAATIDTIKP